MILEKKEATTQKKLMDFQAIGYSKLTEPIAVGKNTKHNAQNTKHTAQSTNHNAQRPEHKAQSTKHETQITKHRASSPQVSATQVGGFGGPTSSCIIHMWPHGRCSGRRPHHSFQSSAFFSPLSLSLWRPGISSSALSERRQDQITELISCYSLNRNGCSKQRRRNTPRWWVSTKAEELQL